MHLVLTGYLQLKRMYNLKYEFNMLPFERPSQTLGTTHQKSLHISIVDPKNLSTPSK